MKMEYRWFQVGARSVLFLSSVVVLAGCSKVNVQCPPSTETEFMMLMKMTCKKDDAGKCIPDMPRGCICR